MFIAFLKHQWWIFLLWLVGFKADYLSWDLGRRGGAPSVGVILIFYYVSFIFISLFLFQDLLGFFDRPFNSFNNDFSQQYIYPMKTHILLFSYFKLFNIKTRKRKMQIVFKPR